MYSSLKKNIHTVHVFYFKCGVVLVDFTHIFQDYFNGTKPCIYFGRYSVNFIYVSGSHRTKMTRTKSMDLQAQVGMELSPIHQVWQLVKPITVQYRCLDIMLLPEGHKASLTISLIIQKTVRPLGIVTVILDVQFLTHLSSEIDHKWMSQHLIWIG